MRSNKQLVNGVTPIISFAPQSTLPYAHLSIHFESCKWANFASAHLSCGPAFTRYQITLSWRYRLPNIQLLLIQLVIVNNHLLGPLQRIGIDVWCASLHSRCVIQSKTLQPTLKKIMGTCGWRPAPLCSPAVSLLVCWSCNYTLQASCSGVSLPRVRL